MRAILPIIIIAIIFPLTACEKKGPAEKLGEKIDQTIEETKENVQQTKEKIEDAVKK